MRGMKTRTVQAGGVDLAVFIPDGDSPTATQLIWAHGWGHTHRNMLPLADAMRHSVRSTLVDLPGFGASPPPPGPWGTEDYADAIAEWLSREKPARRIWIGHSFGCRVGLQLAARHPGLIDGLFLIAAAGLPRRRTSWARARMTARRSAFRLVRLLTPEGPSRDRLRRRFGSADYRAAGPELRPILVKAVNEDLSAVARAVRVPAMLVVGDRDRDTPPELSERLVRLMPQARLVVLRGFDHLDVLTEGRHQIIQRLAEFVEQLP